MTILTRTLTLPEKRFVMFLPAHDGTAVYISRWRDEKNHRLAIVGHDYHGLTISSVRRLNRVVQNERPDVTFAKCDGAGVITSWSFPWRDREVAYDPA